MTAGPDHPPSYVGRFAPSPTGPLHFGSLVAALASYLDARSRSGQWLVRIEDLDPPREIPGAAEAILRSLEAHHLTWDGQVLFQSQRGAAYQDALRRMDAAALLYPCYCSRKMVAAAGGVYRGTCRPRKAGSALAAVQPGKPPAALRLKTSALPPAYAALEQEIEFEDLVFGPQHQNLASTTGDFIVRRKDGFIAYQLAVVVDDMAQGISHVIRGSDLLDSTAQQIYLHRLLGSREPRYGHIPVVVNQAGQKLSKQQGAPALDDTCAADNLRSALAFLAHPVPQQLADAPCGELLDWASIHWKLERLLPSRGLPAQD